MARIVTLHSCRGGTGKSSTAANMALLLAAEGRRVALVDADIRSPAVETMFGSPGGRDGCSLADYLVGRCEIEDAVRPLASGGLFIVPARTGMTAINEISANGYDVGLLNEGFGRLIAALDLDVLLLDTHTGINTETVMAVAGADALVIVTRADRLDLAGAAESVALADRFGCVRRAVVVNMVPDAAPRSDLVLRAETAYGTPVTAVLPYVPEMAELAGEQIFVSAHPGHSLVAGYQKINSAVL
ncbi:MinD/ParA family ATP-binding protein [Sphaerisporangium fuscum]|uniref:MinD/ParA family ATP-binding protein n=1 Tax=Sphaerisporangium fuscum TaxID=2835868 RepID=UPI001BDC4DD6|nr:MinD/ParA family protein [Sphaerisporangium fuscum]